MNHFDKEDFPFKKALYVTTFTVAQWANFFNINIVDPEDTRKEGELMGTLEQKKEVLEKSLDWMYEHFYGENLFGLFLRNKTAEGEVIKFDHADDTDCWRLNLTKQEFSQLQQEWKKNDLPEDLFVEIQEE